jgi:hypothetical protein
MGSFNFLKVTNAFLTHNPRQDCKSLCSSKLKGEKNTKRAAFLKNKTSQIYAQIFTRHLDFSRGPKMFGQKWKFSSTFIRCPKLSGPIQKFPKCPKLFEHEQSSRVPKFFWAEI